MLHRNGITASACLLALVPSAWGAPPAKSKPERLRALSPLVHMPATRGCFEAMVTQMRTSFAALFLKGISKGADLGPDWGPGNPNHAKVRELIETQLVKTESQGTPIFFADFSVLPDFLAQEFSDDEVLLLEQALRTELGRAKMDLADTLIFQGMEGSLGELGVLTDEVSTKIRGLKEEAGKTFSVRVTQVPALIRKDPKLNQRLDAFINRLGKETGMRLGERIMKAPMERAMAAIYPVFGEIQKLIQQFKQNAAAETPTSPAQ